MTESQMQIVVAGYIATRYPDVLFHSDFGSGAKLTKVQAIINSRQNAGRRGWPDLFIAAPRIVEGELRHGLFVELKKDGIRLTKKDGSWSSDHIIEQAETLEALRDEGYYATFAVGYDEAVGVIDNYLKQPSQSIRANS